MTQKALDRLKEESFFLTFGFISNSRAVYRALQRSEVVCDLKAAILQGEVTEESLRRFVAELLADLHIGTLFPYDLSLAALAVAIETRATGFAEEFIRDLSRLELRELPISIRVARQCAQIRSNLAGNTTAFMSLITHENLPTEWQHVPPFAEPEAGQVEKHFEYGAL